jgi:hypothetical protein
MIDSIESGPGRICVATRVGEELGQELGVATLFRRPHRDGDLERQALEPPREVAEPAQRRGVRPVQIVDREDGRAVVRDVRREPVEAVEHRERGVGVLPAGDACRIEERLRERRGAREELCPELRRGRRDERLAVPGAGLRLADQARLPDAGRPLDQREAALAVSHRFDALRERGQLLVPLQQLDFRPRFDHSGRLLSQVRQHRQNPAVVGGVSR